MDRELVRDEVARHVGVSPGHLSELLKERTGRSFVELLRETRIQAACEMLAQTEMPLSEIAAACGFCDQSYFTHVFRDGRGMTPKQYRGQSQSGAVSQMKSPAPIALIACEVFRSEIDLLAAGAAHIVETRFYRNRPARPTGRNAGEAATGGGGNGPARRHRGHRSGLRAVRLRHGGIAGGAPSAGDSAGA